MATRSPGGLISSDTVSDQLATDQRARTLEGHSDSVSSVAFSPGGNAVLQTLEGHSDSVGSVAFSPDGKHVVSGSVDKRVRLWDIVTGAVLQTFEGHSESVSSVAFSPDGKHVVSGSVDKTVRLWDAVTSARIVPLPRAKPDHIAPLEEQPTLEQITADVKSPAATPDFDSLISEWTSTLQRNSKLEKMFLESLQGQEAYERKRGQALVFEFSPQSSAGGPATAPAHYSAIDQDVNARKFKDLICTLTKCKAGEEKRSLVILQDLGREWIEALATVLHVPLHVFAQHWASPEYHIVGEVRIPLGQDLHSYFVLNYDQIHPIVFGDEVDKDAVYQLDCCADRSLSFMSEGVQTNEVSTCANRGQSVTQMQTSSQLLSYWSCEIGANSWIAVMLVDPPLGPNSWQAIYVKNSPGAKAKKVWKPFTRRGPPPEPLPRLRSLGDFFGYPSKCPLGESMLDDLKAMYHGQPTSDPCSITYGSRQLVLAINAATVQRTYSKALDLQVKSTVGLEISKEMSSFDFKEFEKRAWNTEWEGRRFTKLWDQREDLELLRLKLRRNIQTIKGLATADRQGEYQSSTPGTLQLTLAGAWPSSLRSVSKLANATGEPLPEWKVKQYLRALNQQEQDELREWTELEDTAEYINQVILRTTDSYMQTVGAGQAQVSNFQARFVGQLTKMATVFVPVSLVAAIFAIAPQNSNAPHFWIFWAVSMPFVGFLIFWMFGLDIWKAMKKFGNSTVKWFKERREVVDPSEDDEKRFERPPPGLVRRRLKPSKNILLDPERGVEK